MGKTSIRKSEEVSDEQVFTTKIEEVSAYLDAKAAAEPDINRETLFKLLYTDLVQDK